jgi:hypothetical protein
MLTPPYLKGIGFSEGRQERRFGNLGYLMGREISKVVPRPGLLST